MLSIAICDDEKIILKYTERLVKSVLNRFDPEVEVFPSAEALLQSISVGDYCPDIAILDIELGNIDGITLAKRLNEIASNCKIIFLTNYVDYAPEVYLTDHIWFVTKKDMEQRISSALEKAVSLLNNNEDKTPSIVIKSASNTTLLPVSHILYFELCERKTKIVTESGQFLTGRSPKELLDSIPDDLIVRCHQSFHVNLSKIRSIVKDELILSNGVRIPIGRTFKNSLKDSFFSSIRT